MKNIYCIAFITVLFHWHSACTAQISNQPSLNGIQSYVNPILPGDHPDQTLLRSGNDFYSTGSNFHFTPYLPILHSTDLMHWETIARVIPPTSNIPNNDAPSAGTWEGALAFFNNKYWVYFSNNAGGGQYFCNATNMAGPWSAPVKVNTNTGIYGYDNSIFVDDDGTPWMLLKNGQDMNGLQKLAMDGQPVGQALNMNWVNANGHPYSWAEGPVMCKRNGRYYLFVAGDVSGGQYVLSSPILSNVESDWTRHGTFWSAGTSQGGFTGPNHISQPVKLDDGTWWCLSHAYNNGGWEGQGRQSHLHQVLWDANGVPKGIPVSTNPVLGPNLPSSGIHHEYDKSDYFESSKLSFNWHFFNKTMASASRYSLTERPGFLRLKPGAATTHILQKDKGEYYSLTTKVDLNATVNGQEAGIRIMNGNDDLYFNLYASYNNGKKIGMAFSGTSNEVTNTIGNIVWLRVERAAHMLTGFYSADGLAWTQLFTRDISSLDKSQTNWNQWVGTSIGLYASNVNADFDQFSYRYGFVPIRVEGKNNWVGTTFTNATPGRVVTNSASGDWLMLAGVDLGLGNNVTNGTKLTTLAISKTGGKDVWSNFSSAFNASGQHDIYLRWIGPGAVFYVNTMRFIRSKSIITDIYPSTNFLNINIYPNPSNGILFIEGDANLPDASFTIIDMSGNEYHLSQTTNGSGVKIDLSPLATGSYILIIKTDTSIFRKKITTIK
jgi:beta-xylosidase